MPDYMTRRLATFPRFIFSQFQSVPTFTNEIIVFEISLSSPRNVFTTIRVAVARSGVLVGTVIGVTLSIFGDLFVPFQWFASILLAYFVVGFKD
jgi:hypothetical protein